LTNLNVVIHVLISFGFSPLGLLCKRYLRPPTRPLCFVSRAIQRGNHELAVARVAERRTNITPYRSRLPGVRARVTASTSLPLVAVKMWYGNMKVQLGML